jgi:hypothetical protein
MANQPFHIPTVDNVVDMTEEQRLVVHVRTILCGTQCFPSYEVDVLVRRFKCGVSAAQDGRMTTWVPKNSYPILLAGTSNIGNIVVASRTGDAYSLSSLLQIPPLPAGAILVGNCTLDEDDSFKVLFFDGERLPDHNDSSTATDSNSVERYERLRNFFPRYMECSEHARKTFVLQWLGYHEHCSKFLTGEINVGHPIGGLISTTNDAMTPTRPVRVQVPCITIGKFKSTNK